MAILWASSFTYTEGDVHSVNILTMSVSLIQVLFETENLGTEWNKLTPNKMMKREYKQNRFHFNIKKPT